MSQIVRISKTKLKDKEMLIQALKDLGCDITVSKLQDKIVIKKPGISFERKGQFYNMVYVTRRSIEPKTEFLNQVTQRYIYNITVKKLEQQGFSMASEQTEKDGRIHMVLRRVA